ncbi:hypothetical protein Lepil_4041 [Leptonema illini DSM 21528]|uniref:Lipoprotein n=1 Tax=Leptonema illini DSM 21528 TaxID=929563 RepID=H2CC16_9LEPT|nr:hypothetical protein Lepil_4041 [Leptonema illini DSM 21528]
MKHLIFAGSLFLGFGFLSSCIPGEHPSQNKVVPLILSLAYTPAPPEAVRTQIVEEMFPASGPLALVEGEREYLQYQMLERYNQGFYEPAVQPLIARDMQSVFASALEEDGTTMASLNADFRREVERVLTTAPEGILWNIRYIAANSAVMSDEMLQEEGFWAGDISREDFEENKRFMLALYETVSLEIERRQGQ